MSVVDILPGEPVRTEQHQIKLGLGLLHLDDDGPIVATRAGRLEHAPNKRRWWVQGNARRYVPAPQESVVGIVLGRSGEGWRVDIGSAHPAHLDGLAFEGATKRSKPNLKVGALVYARVSLAHKDMDPELECFDAQSRKSDGFGELTGGFLVQSSLRMSQLALDPSHFLLKLLGSRFPLQVAVGTNGRIWVSAKGTEQTIAVVRCIEAVDPDGGGMNEADVEQFLSTIPS